MLKKTITTALGAAVLPLLFSTSAMALSGGPSACSALNGKALEPGTDMRIVSAVWHEDGSKVAIPFMKTEIPLPAHCEVKGIQEERVGANGQHYAIRFHLRLPQAWNNRFFFEGGGGTNGNLGLAIGMWSGPKPALLSGYAVVSQDSGHSNDLNSPPELGGQASFGLDPLARANYGGRSLKLVTESALAIIRTYYGGKPQKSYFAGCSKGGEEGMYLAQRYPALFDGIIAAAPGFSLPKAAIAEAWDTRAFAKAAGQTAKDGHFSKLSSSFTDAQLALVDDAVLDACDADDGLKDGMVGAFERCTTKRVLPELKKRLCTTSDKSNCLTEAQIDAMVADHRGPHTSTGEPLYASFPWSPGMNNGGWRMWKMGFSPQMPGINVLMGASSLATIFSTPPKVLPPDPQAAFLYQVGYDFDTKSQQIFATSATFPRSAWQDISARSPDISAFTARGGKMIVPHGATDPVFSINDTIAWWNEVNAAQHGRAANTVRVFPVPGMNHCMGGSATDQYDAFGALVHWVEDGKAPERIVAHTGPGSRWPNRQRPLCPYPKVAVYKGAGDTEAAESFECR